MPNSLYISHTCAQRPIHQDGFAIASTPDDSALHLALLPQIPYVLYWRFITVLAMTSPARTDFKAGRLYRTRDLRQWSANPTRLAQRMVKEGKLRRAAQGLFYAPIPSRFGAAPPKDTEIIRAFFGDSPFIISGPPRWNSLGLGSTALFAATLIYNTKRSGEFRFDGRPYLLRRVLFPKNPSPEYFVIDLLQQHDMAGVSLSELERGLVATLYQGRWDNDRLEEMGKRFGSKTTQALVNRALRGPKGTA